MLTGFRKRFPAAGTCLDVNLGIMPAGSLQISLRIFCKTPYLLWKNRWYRYQRFLENGKLEGNLFWSEISGFMPLCDILTKVSGETVQLQRVKWETVNSVYLPVETLYVRYSESGEVEHSQRMTISNIKVT